MKTYNFVYRTEVFRAAVVKANNLEDAKEYIKDGHFEDVDEFDTEFPFNLEIVTIEEDQ